MRLKQTPSYDCIYDWQQRHHQTIGKARLSRINHVCNKNYAFQLFSNVIASWAWVNGLRLGKHSGPKYLRS